MKVLIIEDDPALIRVYERAFKTRKGIDIDFALDGEEGLKKLEDHPDVVLLDLIMPKMNGFTFLEKKKKLEDVKGIPVIVVTNLSGVQNRIQVKKLGVKQYFEKANVDLKRIINSVEAYV